MKRGGQNVRHPQREHRSPNILSTHASYSHHVNTSRDPREHLRVLSNPGKVVEYLVPVVVCSLEHPTGESQGESDKITFPFI
jgi:hypothetical protein